MLSRELWQGGPDVGAVGLGCMPMSWGYSPAERDDEESVAVVREALDLGVSLIDTADAYGPFRNEELVGRAIAGRRDDVVLATKVGLVMDEGGTVGRDGRPEHVREGCEASLRRLGVDHIDLYQLHRVDEDVPLSETWGAMAELVTAGKVGAIGMSEVDVAQLTEAHAIHRVATVQSEMSLWTRSALDDVLPWCEANGAGFIPFSPLGRGYLTGTLDAATFEEADFRARNPRFTPEAMAANQRIVDAVRAVADRVGASAAQVAIAWLLTRGERVVPIPGTKRRRWLRDNAAAADLVLPPAEIAELDALPPAVGARY